MGKFKITARVHSSAYYSFGITFHSGRYMHLATLNLFHWCIQILYRRAA